MHTLFDVVKVEGARKGTNVERIPPSIKLCLCFPFLPLASFDDVLPQRSGKVEYEVVSAVDPGAFNTGLFLVHRHNSSHGVGRLSTVIA
ncbi:hypothetical protein ACIQZN_34870 [Streptomyces sp. NPDC097595]|uniref:hypothetical protein n=1 Tax=Streptomyces sp. NPDC097595 TaxID=3366090 RepID=UPI0038306E4A